MKRKPINMATGGLMSMPPYIKSQDKSDEGITPYDISTPESARKGLPSRLLSKSRTRFSKGKEAKKKKDEVPIWTEEEWEEMNAKKDKIKEKKILLASADDNFDDALAEEIRMEEEDFNAWVRENNKRIRDKNKKAMGGLLKRKKYRTGDEVLDEDTFEEYPIKDLEEELAGEQVNAKEIIEKNKFDRLEGLKESGIDLTPKQEKDLEEYKAKTRRVKAALGGMIGVEKGKYDQRPDYQAYAEGDIVEEETMEEEVPMEMDMEDSLLEKPVGMDEEMQEDITDEDMEGMDAIIDTSALSEEEETLLDEAVDMHPELEAIIPKLVATEFTDDGEVEGPGTGTSDSIPALLSDGEFVFTAKAVKNIGVDKLRKMMAQAEESFDAGNQSQIDQEIV